MHIVFSYFEMLGKYLDGYTGRESKKYFRRGVNATFPEIGNDADDFLDLLYSSVRSGLYHTGMTKINVALLSNIQGSIGFDAERKLLAINPDRLVEDLDVRFQQYISELRNPKNVKLRENFERRFDYDNSEMSL